MEAMGRLTNIPVLICISSFVLQLYAGNVYWLAPSLFAGNLASYIAKYICYAGTISIIVRLIM